MRALVIYYDGNYTKAKMVETTILDSSAPHVYGLPEDYEVNAVIGGFKETEDFVVYIDEEAQEFS